MFLIRRLFRNATQALLKWQISKQVFKSKGKAVIDTEEILSNWQFDSVY